MSPIYAHEAVRSAQLAQSTLDEKEFELIMDKVWNEIAYRSEHGYYGGEYLFYIDERPYLPLVKEELLKYGYTVYVTNDSLIDIYWRSKE